MLQGCNQAVPHADSNRRLLRPKTCAGQHNRTLRRNPETCPSRQKGKSTAADALRTSQRRRHDLTWSGSVARRGRRRMSRRGRCPIAKRALNARRFNMSRRPASQRARMVRRHRATAGHRKRKTPARSASNRRRGRRAATPQREPLLPPELNAYRNASLRRAGRRARPEPKRAAGRRNKNRRVTVSEKAAGAKDATDTKLLPGIRRRYGHSQPTIA